MLEDRDYMRQPAFYRPRVSFTVLILIANAIVFIAQLIASHSLQGQEILDEYFVLSIGGLEHFYLWQLLTFQFMHAGLIHIILNSIVIYFFGRVVETAVGGTKFLTLYFSAGVIGGLLQMLFGFLFPGTIGSAIIGASAGAAGLISAFAVLNWRQPFTLFIYFFPVTMRGRTLFLGSIAVVLIMMLSPLGRGVANVAHLGGILTGFIFARYLISKNWSFPKIPFFSRKEKSFWRSQKTDADLSAEEFLQKEVDPILEKISAHGIHSLTRREREILEKARVKINRH